MRAIKNVLCVVALALFGLTSMVNAACVEQSKRGPLPSGYEPVRIVFAAAQDDRVSDDTKESTLRFLVDGLVRVAFDKLGHVKQVHQCSFGNGSVLKNQTFVQVRYVKVPGNDDLIHGESWIGLPKQAIASKPDVGVELTSGTELKGVWGRSNAHGREVATITIGPVD